MTRAVPLERRPTGELEQQLKVQRRRKAEATTPGTRRAAKRTIERILEELNRRRRSYDAKA